MRYLFKCFFAAPTSSAPFVFAVCGSVLLCVFYSILVLFVLISILFVIVSG